MFMDGDLLRAVVITRGDNYMDEGGRGRRQKERGIEKENMTITE